MLCDARICIGLTEHQETVLRAGGDARAACNAVTECRSGAAVSLMWCRPCRDSNLGIADGLV